MNDNKLIAEFMGLPEQNNEYENPYSGEYVEAIELSYDESWDWLMPVVEACYHNGAEEQEIGDITHALLDCDMKNLYEAVVEFIKEFNLKS